MIYLSGGPSHQDMYDLKTDAPKEIRGSFQPINTNVPGIEICEHMPRLARMMDKFTIIRSLYGGPDQHASDLCLSGYPIGPKGRQDNHPSLGSVLAKLQGLVDQAVPPFVGLTIKTRHAPYSNPGLPGFLGQAHAPFQPDGEGMANMRLNGVTLDQLRDRQSLLASFDSFRRQADSSAAFQGIDSFTRKAFDVLTSSRLVDALDLEHESRQVRESYGGGSAAPAFGEDAGPHWMDQFLMARRLVEVGVRCVTLSFGSWDRHGGNFERLPEQLGKFDLGITALVEDLHARGLDQDVSVVAWGEFGRTPRINPGGRSRPLAAGVVRPARRRWHEDGAGHRFYEPAGRSPARPADSLPGRIRHAIPATGHRRGHDDDSRSERASPVPARPPRTHPGIGVSSAHHIPGRRMPHEWLDLPDRHLLTVDRQADP